MQLTWWGAGNYIDTDEDVYETDGRSIVFFPATSGTYYLISRKPKPVIPGQRLKARARFMSDIASSVESRPLIGIAFYEADGTYINTFSSYAQFLSGMDDTWVTASHEVCVDDVADAAYYRTVIGAVHGSGDTNTIWCDVADIVVEPSFQFFEEATPSIGGSNQILFASPSINAQGIFRHSGSGELIVQEGGTWVVRSAATVTAANGVSARLDLYRGVFTGDILNIVDFAQGDEHTIVTANLAQVCAVSGIQRFNAGDRLYVIPSVSAGFSLGWSTLSAVRVGA